MTLSLFFTRNISLKNWLTQGLFDREKLIYEAHLNQNYLDKVYWFTYGSGDKKLAEQLKRENRLHEDIEVFEMPRFFNLPKIGSFLYSFILPFYYKNILQKSDILKTNQMDGGWSSVISKWLYKKKLIARTGYTLSQLEYSKNKNSFRYVYYKFIENFVYNNCDMAIVTSENNKLYLLENKFLPENKINIILNYIDINRFKPLNLERYKNKILFVGRLNNEKNIFNLIQAISQTNLTLDIYGEGDSQSELISFAKEKKVSINFMGTISNIELVNIYNRYKYYILPSYFEGMPKTLLEAMSCGCVCIGTDVNGINEVIIDNINGYLAHDTSADSLTKTINKIIKLDTEDVIQNGINNVRDNFSLLKVSDLENKIFKELTHEKQ